MRVQRASGVLLLLITPILLIYPLDDAEAKTSPSASEIKTKLRRAEKRLATRNRATFQVEISPKKISELISASSRKSNKAVKLQLPTANGLINVKLTQTDVVAPNYVALETSKSGVKILPNNFYTFTGKVSPKEKDDFLALTLFESASGVTKVEGLFKGRGKLYTIKSDSKTSFAAYTGGAAKKEPVESEPFEVREVRASDLRAMTRQIPIDHVHRSLRAGASTSSIPQTPAAVPEGILEAYIATDADFSYLKQAKSTNNPSAANAKIISIINSVNGIYQNQLGIKIKVSFQHAWTTQDPYGPAGDSLLSNFAHHWTNNFENTVAYTAAHLFTGKSLGGGAIGRAYLGGSCNNGIKYGASMYWDAPMAGPLFAHEFGHNMGADHVIDSPRWIMYPTLTTAQQSFSPPSISEVTAHKQSVFGRPGCLRLESAPMEKPPSIDVEGFALANGKSGINVRFSLPQDSSNISGISVFRSESAGNGCTGTPVAQSVTDLVFFDATAQAGKAYYYSVRAIGWDNQLGECSAGRIVEVGHSAPTITYFGPHNLIVNAGDTVEYRVETSGSNGNLTYEWSMYSNVNGAPGNPVILPEARGPVLTLTNVNASHNSKFFGVVVRVGSEGVASPVTYLRVQGGTTDTYRIQGVIASQVSDKSGVTIDGGSLGSTMTDSMGRFAFNNVSRGFSYTITPSKNGFRFDPPNGSGVVFSDTEVQFTQTETIVSPQETVTIEGYVREAGTNRGVAGIFINSNGHTPPQGHYNLGAGRHTDSNGRFVFQNVPKGVRYWILAHNNIKYSVEPSSIEGVANSDTTLNITAQKISYSVSGGVYLTGPSGIAGVTMNVPGRGAVVTQSDGTFQFENIEHGSTITITPSLQGYSFFPDQLTITVDEDEYNLIFTAQPLVNPDLACQKSFVQALHNRMINHTIEDSHAEAIAGFLTSGNFPRDQVLSLIFSREEWTKNHVPAIRVYELLGEGKGRNADYAGYAYWTNELKSGRATKLSMVNSFIRSPEYRASFGNAAPEPAFTFHIYRNSLWRSPTIDEVNYWQSRYQTSTSPQQAALQIALESTESINQQYRILFSHILPLAVHNRDPLPNEVELIDAALTKNPEVLTQIINAYLSSEDFSMPCDTTSSVLSRSELISWLRNLSDPDFSWQNPRNRYDVNNDGMVQEDDVNLIENELNQVGARALPPLTQPAPFFYDVNGDGSISAIDALLIINRLNRNS